MPWNISVSNPYFMNSIFWPVEISEWNCYQTKQFIIAILFIDIFFMKFSLHLCLMYNIKYTSCNFSVTYTWCNHMIVNIVYNLLEHDHFKLFYHILHIGCISLFTGLSSITLKPIFIAWFYYRKIFLRPLKFLFPCFLLMYLIIIIIFF